MKILLAGGYKSKISLISELIPGLTEYSIQYFFYGKKGMIHVTAAKNLDEKHTFTERTLQVESIWIPHEFELFCHTDDDTCENILKRAANCDRVVFIEAHTYTSFDFTALIEALYEKKNLIESHVVFYQPGFQYGSTDFISEDMSIEQSREKLMNTFSSDFIRSMIDPIVVYKRGEPLVKLLQPAQCCSLECGAILKEKFRLWKDSMDDLFQRELFIESVVKSILESDTFNVFNLERSVFAFEKVRGSRNLIESFANLFLKNCYEKHVEKILEYYHDLINKELCIWDLEADCVRLRERLNQRFHERISQGLRLKVYLCPDDKLSYKKLQEKERFKEKFKENLMHFYKTDCVKVVFCHLNEKIQHLSEILEEQRVQKNNKNRRKGK